MIGRYFSSNSPLNNIPGKCRLIVVRSGPEYDWNTRSGSPQPKFSMKSGPVVSASATAGAKNDGAAGAVPKSESDATSEATSLLLFFIMVSPYRFPLFSNELYELSSTFCSSADPMRFCISSARYHEMIA